MRERMQQVKLRCTRTQDRRRMQIHVTRPMTMVIRTRPSDRSQPVMGSDRGTGSRFPTRVGFRSDIMTWCVVTNLIYEFKLRANLDPLLTSTWSDSDFNPLWNPIRPKYRNTEFQPVMENGTSSSIGGLNMEWRSVGDWAVSQCYELKGLRVFTWRRFPTDGPIKPEIGPTGQIGKSGPIPKNRKTEKPDFLDYTGGLRNTTPPGAKVRERRRETKNKPWWWKPIYKCTRWTICTD